MNIIERNNLIVEKYLSQKVFTESIAKEFGISTRQVQRIVKNAGVAKTLTERNREMAPFKSYSEKKLPKQITEYRKFIPQDMRYLYLQANPICSVCGIKRGFGFRMEIIVKNLKCSPNDPTNLKTMCRRCISKEPSLMRPLSN